MKLAISNIAWSYDETDRVKEVLRRHSIAGVEVAPTLLFENPCSVTDQEATHIKEYWKNLGISIVAMQALLFGHPELVIFQDKESRQLTVNYLERIISLAGHLDAKSLVFGSPKNRKTEGISADEVSKISRTFFRKMGKIALANNTTFCIEPNAVQYGCDFVTNTEEAVQLVRYVNHPGFKLHLDAGVMTINDESYDKALEIALPFIKHFHISEPFLGRITDNKTDHAVLGHILRRLGYNEWLSIEMKSGLGEDNVVVVDECLKFVKQHYLS